MRRAFTLIELLIVVAIIAILAAIAVPNFLEAQVRAKVSRAVSDMRTIATAVSSYEVDANRPPPSAVDRARITWNKPVDGAGYIISWRDRLVPLTTPIAYITSVPDDPFAAASPLQAINPDFFSTYQYNEDHYVSLAQRAQLSPPDGPPFEGYVSLEGTDVGWRLVSQGPDQTPNFLDSELQSLGVNARDALEYDPTNGTVSKGDVIRYGGPDRGSLYQ